MIGFPTIVSSSTSSRDGVGLRAEVADELVETAPDGVGELRGRAGWSIT